ncbi:Arm DNA-binding domain-containing protein [Bacillus paramycoides]|uniref:Arm DNA-binding domain-containing protein n=1 Tax=Bacillus paramycoides TaxID=2026194 RepID=UPI003D02D33E
MKGHIRKRGSKWAIIIDIGPNPETGKRRQKWFSGYKTKKEAQADMAKRIVEIEEGSYIEPTKMRVREFFLQYLEARKINLRETTYYNYRKYINISYYTKTWKHSNAKIKRCGS